MASSKSDACLENNDAKNVSGMAENATKANYAGHGHDAEGDAFSAPRTPQKATSNPYWRPLLASAGNVQVQENVRSPSSCQRVRSITGTGQPDGSPRCPLGPLSRGASRAYYESGPEIQDAHLTRTTTSTPTVLTRHCETGPPLAQEEIDDRDANSFASFYAPSASDNTSLNVNVESQSAATPGSSNRSFIQRYKENRASRDDSMDRGSYLDGRGQFDVSEFPDDSLSLPPQNRTFLEESEMQH
ncbi:hypothetical protein KEM55_006438, partial [Ascosphaera atra]